MNIKTRVAAIAASTAILAAGVVAPATAAGPAPTLRPGLDYCQALTLVHWWSGWKCYLARATR